jgi:hypothetical protein
MALQEDRVFTIGKTTIRFHAPQITQEEYELRLEKIHRAMWLVWDKELRFVVDYSTDKE